MPGDFPGSWAAIPANNPRKLAAERSGWHGDIQEHGAQRGRARAMRNAVVFHRSVPTTQGGGRQIVSFRPRRLRSGRQGGEQCFQHPDIDRLGKVLVKARRQGLLPVALLAIAG